MMIVSPLITATGLGEQKAAAPDSQVANAQPPAQQPASSGAAADTHNSDERRHTKRVKPDIELSVEPNSSGRQRSDSPEGFNKNAGDSPTALSDPGETNASAWPCSLSTI